jgi:hypothetical protein
MALNELVAKAQTYFPNLEIKFKDQDPLMKFLGKLMFFNPGFMTNFVTTIGDTIYWPSKQDFEDTPTSSAATFIHECVHIYDEKKDGSPFFKLGYLFPQILALPMLLLLFVLTWKIVIPLALLCLLPWPAPFRARSERRAYFVSMRAAYELRGVDPELSGPHYVKNFKNSSYYWMMPFGEDAKFAAEAVNIKAGNPASASEPELNKMISDLIIAAK